MNAKSLYLLLGVAGTVLPYFQLLPFIRDHGPDMRLFVAQLFANPVSSFFGLDVLVSSVVLWAFVVIEGRRAGMKHLWAPQQVSRSECRSDSRCSSTCARTAS